MSKYTVPGGQRKTPDERPFLKRGIGLGDVERFRQIREREARARRGESG